MTAAMAAEPPAQGARTAANAALVLSARVLSKVGAFVVVVLMVNSLGATGYGLFSVLVTMSSLVSTVADLGTATLLVREASRDRARLEPLFGALLAARLPLALAALAVLAIALVSSGHGLLEWVWATFALLFSASLATLCRSVFYATGELGFEAVAILGETLILTGLTVLGVRAGAGIGWFLWSYAGAYAFTTLFSLAVTSRRYLRIRPRLDPGLIVSLVRRGFPFAFATVVSTLYFKLDVPLLNWFGVSPRMIGWYSAGYKPVEALLFIPTTVAVVLFPALSAIAGHRDRMISACSQMYRTLCLTGLPIGVGTVLLADRLTAFARLYPESAPVLRVLGLGIALLFVNNVFIAALGALGRQSDYARLTVVTLTAALALYLVMIPLYSYMGAAWATVLTEVVLFGGGWWLLRRHLFALPLLRPLPRPLLAAAVMAALVALGREWNLALVVGAGGIVYLLVLVLTRELGPEDLALARASIARLRPGAAP
ncbi:MAG: flippase [Candidatus Dormibacteria bacterium]